MLKIVLRIFTAYVRREDMCTQRYVCECVGIGMDQVRCMTSYTLQHS